MVPFDDFDPVSAAIAEDEECTSEGIEFEASFDDANQAIDTLTHIGSATG